MVAVLGVGGAGAMVALAPYRPYMLVATALLLGLGFFLVYRKRPTAAAVAASGRVEGAEGDACGCDEPAPRRQRNLAKIILWVATVLVVAFSVSPYVIGASADASGTEHGAIAVLDSEIGTATDTVPAPSVHAAQIPVAGMDCASCAVAIERAMQDVGEYSDFSLDLEGQTIAFRFEGDEARAERFAAAIRDIGYEVGEPTIQ